MALLQTLGSHPVRAAGILFFVTSLDDHDDGVCNADCTLREAIQAANSNPGDDDGIEFTVTGTINLLSVLPDIAGGVSIDGPGASLLTVQRDNSAAAFRIFNVTTTSTASFSGLTITGGLSTGVTSLSFGGGIRNSTGVVNVNNSGISGNHGTGVGGVFNSGGTLTVTNSTVSGNISNSGDLLGFGPSVGGIFNSGGTVTVTNSTVSGNLALMDRGDGVYYAGGIFNAGGTLAITNSSVFGNVAFNPVTTSFLVSGGGGILNSGTTATITNSTISGNTALSLSVFSSVCGGVYNVGAGTANVKTSIIALNSSDSPLSASTPRPDILGTFASHGFNLIGKSDGGTGFTDPTDLTGTVASPLDPQLETDGMGNPLLKDNGGPTMTIALLCGSPAIDQGSSNGLTGAVTTDQRGTGFPRIVDDPTIANASGGDGTDIGALEAQICAAPTPTATPTPTPTTLTPTATATATETPAATATPTSTAVVCPLSQGYWKTHPAAWPVISLSLGSQTYTQAELLTILSKPVVGDASLILSRQLIAAKLNIANGSDAAMITATITSADSLLSSFSGRLPYKVKPSSSIGQAMTSLAALLDHYNSGRECPARW